MSVKASRLALCAAGAVLLSGCQFIGNLHLAHGASRSDPGKAAMDQYFTARGVVLLRSGQPGAAIEAFNLALATGEAPAAAYNGLGIAYARIARPDLAYRFFQKAKMSDPSNPTYTANLDRLVKSPQFTLDMALAGSRPPTAAAPAGPASQAGLAAQQDGAATPSQPGHLRRTGAHQFSLITLPVDANAAPPQMRRAHAQTCPARRNAPRQKGCTATMQTSARSTKAPAANLAATDPTSGATSPAPAGKRKVIDMPIAPMAETPATGTKQRGSRRIS